jgi:ABC-2 type transport system ATP-binding protein
VGLAQAIIGYPKVIILDEPSVGLDPKQIIEMRELIKKLGENHTVILSSHILSEVSAVCDHIMIISKGKLVASESTENLSKLMSGGDELALTIKGVENEVKGTLIPMTGVVSVEVTGVRGEEVDALVAVDKGADIREAVFFKLAEKKMPILSMSLSQKSLEDIFLELTGDQSSGEVVEEEQDNVGDL